MHRLDAIDKDLMKIIIKFLKPFHDATVDMDASKYAMIHMDFLWRRKLLNLNTN